MIEFVKSWRVNMNINQYMNIEKYKNIYMLQSDYVNGTGKHGPILDKYSELIKQYAAIFKQCIFSAEGLYDKYFNNEKTVQQELKYNVILIIICLLFHVEFSGRLGWVMLSFIIMIVKFWQTQKASWMIIPIAATSFAFLSVLPSLDLKLMWLIVFAPLAIPTLKLVMAWYTGKRNIAIADDINRERMIQLKEKEKKLEEIRSQMKEIEPELRKEYQQLFYDVVKNEQIQDNIKKEYGYLPEKFWWMVSPSELYFEKRSMEIHFTQLLVYQEIKVFSKNQGKEFNAEEEIAPMFAEELSFSDIKTIYHRNKELLKRKDGIILDFINCFTYPEVETNIETVDVYKKNFIERTSETHAWNNLGKEIQQAHLDGKLSDADYGILSTEYDMHDPRVRAAINETTTETQETHKYKEITCFAWTGQALLIPNEELNDGSYVLIDYRCIPEYAYENLRSLNEYNITKIFNDNAYGNVHFIAELHQRFSL